MENLRYLDSLKNPRIPGFEWQEPEDESDRDIFKHILGYGCCCMYINPNEGNIEYSFSIGLYLNFLHPEILVMGLSEDVSHRGINRVTLQAKVGEQVLSAGDERSDLFDLAYPVRFVAVDDKYYFDYLGYAAWFYRSLLFKVSPIAKHKFPVLQTLWADKNGFYPDDPRCHPAARKAQTLVMQD